MIHLQKYSRNAHKNLVSKKEENTLRMKVLRYVMAVGFVLSPWLGGEAYAAGIVPVNGSELSYNDKGTVNIYAQDVKGDVGWNSFTHFNVDAGKIANLHFCKDANGDALNTLVNTVTNQININGTVNAIKKDGTVGGNLYFLSPGGMVVGSTGVINAGSLTVMAPTQKFINNLNFDNLYLFNNIVPLNDSGKITISGQIHASGGVDLRAAYLSISRPVSDNSSFADPSNTNSSATVTAANLFNEVVNLTGNDLGEATALKAVIDAGGKVYLQADKEMTIQNTQINAGGNFDIVARALGTSDTGQLRLENSSIYAVGDLCVDVGGRVDIYNNFALTSDKPSINMYTQTGDIYNYGNFAVNKDLNITAGLSSETESADFTNAGTIQSTGGGVSLTSRNGFTNTGTVQANAQIKFAVGGTLTNQGTIESTSSNVQAHIGRNFKNIAVYNNESTENRTLKGGIIEAGGNVQVDYNLDNEGIGTAKEAGTIDGIYNSGLIWAKGENGQDPVYDDKGNIVNSGSGNIWLTSSYNITNYGTIEAGRQITLNARDFLHNYGLIEGVTYLDIKSIMGYVYNHASGVIRATGGNIDLSTGQANLQIDTDLDGEKKEEYRKFTPIIIEGLVEAFSDKNNKTNQTNQGDIKIAANLGDIYVVEGTIRANAKSVTGGEKESAAGDVILDAAQNITIGFNITPDRADDPTTDNKYGDHPEYESKTEREYYKPILDSNLVPSSPCDEPATISGTNITLKSGSDEKYYILISNTTTGSNALPASNTLTASNAITINTDSMNIVGGTFNAGTLEAVLAENGALNITGGTINAANVNSNRNMIINGGAINTGTAQGSLSANNISMESGTVSGKDVTIAADDQVELKGGSITAEAEGAGKLTVTAGTDLVHNGAIITADNAAFSAGNKIDLKSGSLTATGAAAFGVTTGTAGANSIVESTSGYSLSAGSLSLSANQGNITLNGANNVLQGVTLANVGGNVEIVNGNETNNKALTISTAEGTTVGGTINIVNKGEAITVAGVNATKNVSLTAGGGVSITGPVATDGLLNVNAGTNANITIAGNVNAAAASFDAGQDFIHNAGAIKSDAVEVTAGQDILLNSGSMEASTSASLTAGSAENVASGHGYILEGTGYALIAPQVTAGAVDAITLDSSYNQLENVNITKVGGALAIGSGNKNSTKALQVNIAQGKTVNGSLTIKNYKIDGDSSTNDIVVAGVLSANSITITNAEANINAGTGAVISADSVNLQANSGAVNVTGDATITATNNGTFAANAQDINIAGGRITADTAKLTAANAINQTAGSIVATNTVASAGTDLSLASNANKLQNVTVGTQKGNATIVSSNDAGVALKVQTGGTVGGSLSIQSTSDIVSEGIISAAGDVTMTAGDKVTINSGTINANSVTAKDTDLFVNGGTINVGTLAASKGLNIASNSSNTTNITANNITAGGSIGITGGNVVTTSVAADEALNITGGTVSSDGAVSLSGATGVAIGSAATINTGGDLTISSSGGSVTNNRALTANGGSVTLSGKTDVTNSANITAAQDVTMTATTGNVNNSKVVKANGGNINLTGGTNINLQDGYGLEASDTINLNTDNIEITGGTIKANTLAASGSLNITGGKVDSTGALTISGAKGVTIGSQADITTGNNLTIASSGGAVENNRILNITTGSVTLSGSGGVTNNMNITAAQDIILQSTTGAITNSGILSAGQGIGLTSTEGTILNNGMLTARGSSVSLKGYKDIINNGYIEAKGNVSIISEDGSITNRAGIVAGKSFATPAASPFSLRARAMARAVDNGSVVISGKDGVINHNDNVNTSISAAGSVSITSEVGAVQNSSAVNTSGSVEISGSNVTNSGALTANTGSVTISGSSGVENSANITANDNVTMSSGAGSVTNSSDVKAGTGSVEISGNGGVTNTADITANQNVNLSANAGAISNAGNVTAETGNIGLNSNNGITSTAEGSSLNVNSLNGSISAATTYGEVNISEIIAGGNATASSQNGSVNIGTVAGNDVVLTGGSNVTIGSVTGSDVAITGGSNSDVNVDNITVDNSLKLQGDNITATNVNRSENASGVLNVDVSGAGGTSSTAQGDVNLKIDGDVVFNNLNVTDANIETSGTLDASKMHVEGKAQITSSNTTVNVYGKDVTPDPNDRNAIQDKGGGVSLTIDSNGVKSDDLGVDYPVQLSGKLVDYDPYDTYLEHYGDVADIFGRTDLIIAAESSSSDFAQGGVVILKQDAEGLRIEEQKKEE